MLTAAAILTPLVVSFGFWLKSRRKRMLLKQIAPDGKVGPEILIEKSKLDELKQFVGSVLVIGGPCFLLGVLFGMGFRGL